MRLSQIILACVPVLPLSVSVCSADSIQALIRQQDQHNQSAQSNQQHIDAIDDRTSDLVERYEQTLQSIASMQVINHQLRDELDYLSQQTATLQDISASSADLYDSLLPIMRDMFQALSRHVALDMPFLAEERARRLALLDESLSSAAQDLRSALERLLQAYEVEWRYAKDIEARQAVIIVGERELTVDVLRLGRVGWYFQTLDQREHGFWHQVRQEWVTVGGRYRHMIEQGLRYARRQGAPAWLSLPFPLMEASAALPPMPPLPSSLPSINSSADVAHLKPVSRNRGDQ